MFSRICNIDVKRGKMSFKKSNAKNSSETLKLNMALLRCQNRVTIKKKTLRVQRNKDRQGAFAKKVLCNVKIVPQKVKYITENSTKCRIIFISSLI